MKNENEKFCWKQWEILFVGFPIYCVSVLLLNVLLIYPLLFVPTIVPFYVFVGGYTLIALIFAKKKFWSIMLAVLLSTLTYAVFYSFMHSTISRANVGQFFIIHVTVLYIIVFSIIITFLMQKFKISLYIPLYIIIFCSIISLFYYLDIVKIYWLFVGADVLFVVFILSSIFMGIAELILKMKKRKHISI